MARLRHFFCYFVAISRFFALDMAFVSSSGEETGFCHSFSAAPYGALSHPFSQSVSKRESHAELQPALKICVGIRGKVIAKGTVLWYTEKTGTGGRAMPFFTHGDAKNKLVLLYILSKAGTPLTHDQLYRIVDRTDSMTFFAFETILPELETDGFLAAFVRPYGDCFGLTASGQESLALFADSIQEPTL